MTAITPTNSPSEVIDISPEALEVANCYLVEQDLTKVCDALDMPKEIITQILAKREVKSYIDHVFMNLGFNNRFKMRAAMDAVLKRKFQEMEEADTGSSKDISELLALSHKMSMDELSRQIELEKLRQSNIKTQTNIQINDGGSKYETLIQRLISGST
jgi:hypothetical protein